MVWTVKNLELRNFVVQQAEASRKMLHSGPGGRPSWLNAANVAVWMTSDSENKKSGIQEQSEGG